RVGLRLLQVHLCVVYFVAGWAKAWGSQWWNGEAVWRALMMPEFSQFDVSMLVYAPFVPLLAAWATLFFEMGYPIMIAFQKARKYCLGAVIGMHVGIFFAMGLHTFALMMILWNLAVFTDLPDQLRGKNFRV